MPLVIEVSGTPAFLGGGGCEPSEYGVYAVCVCILRFEEERDIFEEEKCRRTCSQGLIEDDVGNEANLNIPIDDDVKGTRMRCTDMVKSFITKFGQTP